MKFQPSIIFRYDGDLIACDALRGNGARVMSILENLMSFRHLDQYNMTLIPYPGASIHASKAFGLRVVTINAGVAPAPVEPAVKRSCLCNCNFTVGWVFKVQEEMLEEVIPLYTVMACQNEKKYVLVENVLASDWTIYAEFMPVVMVPYYQMAFLCCSGDKSRATGCKKQDHYENNINNDIWRTSLRIVPWCAVGLPKWMEKYG